MHAGHLDATFAALADPTRRAILARLAEGEATVNELAAPLPLTLQAVSKHLKVLEQAGLITRRRAAQQRPCRLRAEPLREVVDWLEQYQEFWAGGFDTLATHLRDIGRAGEIGRVGNPGRVGDTGRVEDGGRSGEVERPPEVPAGDPAE